MSSRGLAACSGPRSFPPLLFPPFRRATTSLFLLAQPMRPDVVILNVSLPNGARRPRVGCVASHEFGGGGQVWFWSSRRMPLKIGSHLGMCRLIGIATNRPHFFQYLASASAKGAASLSELLLVGAAGICNVHERRVLNVRNSTPLSQSTCFFSKRLKIPMSSDV